ncbi:MAG: hypothetical protein Kow0090_03130 [Myxococcota bacterium]
MYDVKRANGIVKAKIEGWVSPSEVKEVFDKVCSVMEGEAEKRVLVDITNVSVLSSPSAAVLVEKLKDTKGEIKLAFLWRNDIFFCAKFEEVLNQLSRPNILGFDSETSAINWLMDYEIPVLLGSNNSRDDTPIHSKKNLEH